MAVEGYRISNKVNVKKVTKRVVLNIVTLMLICLSVNFFLLERCSTHFAGKKERAQIITRKRVLWAGLIYPSECDPEFHPKIVFQLGQRLLKGVGSRHR